MDFKVRPTVNGVPIALGDGDMEKSVYDTDDDGKVDTAETADQAAEANHAAEADHATTADSVPWAGVAGKPTAFPPEAHTHDDRYYTKTALATPSSGATVDYTNIANVPPGGAGGDMEKATYDQDDDGIVDAAEAAPWSGITDKPDIETVSGEIVIGQNTEINGDLTVNGAIHGTADAAMTANHATTANSATTANAANSVPWSGVTGVPGGVYVPLYPIQKAHGPDPLNIGTYTYLVTNFGIPANARAAVVLVGGRWAAASNGYYMNLLAYNTTEEYGGVNAQVAHINAKCVGVVPIINRRFQVAVVGANMVVAYVHILGYYT